MEFELNFFEYKKNCNEFKVLVKATSENAARKELRDGQLLLDLIYKNIVFIRTKLHDIESNILQRNIKITGTEETRNINPHKFEIKYTNDKYNLINQRSINNVNFEFDLDFFYGIISIAIDRIRNYLDSNFDHSENLKEIQNIERRIKEGKTIGNEDLFLPSMKVPIKHSIEEVLKYYSDISFNLKQYLDLFVTQNS